MFSLVFGVALALAHRPQEQEPPRPPDLTPPRADEWVLELLPDRVLYRPYLADPRQSRTGTKVAFPIGNDNEGNIKIENTLGGYRPIALWTNPANPQEEAELVIEAAVFSRFDISESWDLDAADYRFGFPFIYRIDDVAMKVHVYHITSHLGDEFITREGGDRDSYHLDEVSAGFSWPYEGPLRIYAELGAGFYTGPDTESGRAQLGAEWVGAPIVPRIAPFVALDLQTRNEIGWGWNGTVQGGLMILPKTGKGHGLRGSVEYYRGHDQQTQFKSQLEHYYAFGIAADF